MKTLFFHLLTTFRWLVVPSLKILSAMFCIFMLIAIFSDDPSVSGLGNAVLWFLFASILGALSWYYDVAIKKLSPTDQTNQHWS